MFPYLHNITSLSISPEVRAQLGRAQTALQNVRSAERYAIKAVELQSKADSFEAASTALFTASPTKAAELLGKAAAYSEQASDNVQHADKLISQSMQLCNAVTNDITKKKLPSSIAMKIKKLLALAEKNQQSVKSQVDHAQQLTAKGTRHVLL